MSSGLIPRSERLQKKVWEARDPGKRCQSSVTDELSLDLSAFQFESLFLNAELLHKFSANFASKAQMFQRENEKQSVQCGRFAARVET